RPGINTPVAEMWKRYQDEFGISTGDLVAANARPSSTRHGQDVTVYGQYWQGYPVAGFGYFVESENGVFRNANGKVVANLPTTLPSPIDEDTALQSALTYMKVRRAPWAGKGPNVTPPVGQLILMQKRTFPAGADFALVWDFHFGGKGIS